MNCNICGKPVVLSPSAAERAKKDITGKSAEYYTSLFPTHAECTIRKRKQGTLELMRKLKREYEERERAKVIRTFTVPLKEYKETT